MSVPHILPHWICFTFNHLVFTRCVSSNWLVFVKCPKFDIRHTTWSRLTSTLFFAWIVFFRFKTWEQSCFWRFRNVDPIKCGPLQLWGGKDSNYSMNTFVVVLISIRKQFQQELMKISSAEHLIHYIWYFWVLFSLKCFCKRNIFPYVRL